MRVEVNDVEKYIEGLRSDATVAEERIDRIVPL